MPLKHLERFSYLTNGKIESRVNIAFLSREKLGKPNERKYYCFQTQKLFFMASNAPHKRDAKRSARDFVTG